jgi:hypothetical protein
VILLGFLAFAVAAALAAGQARIALRHLRSGIAGWGELTYSKSDRPIAFKVMAALEIAVAVALAYWALNILPLLISEIAS